MTDRFAAHLSALRAGAPWPVATGQHDELVFLFADWRRYFWRMSSPWRNALKDEVGRGDWCPTQAQAVIEGQVG